MDGLPPLWCFHIALVDQSKSMGDSKWKQNCVKGVPSRKKIVQFSFKDNADLS